MYIIRGRGQCYFYIYRYGTLLYIQIYVIQDTDRYIDIWDTGHCYIYIYMGYKTLIDIHLHWNIYRDKLYPPWFLMGAIKRKKCWLSIIQWGQHEKSLIFVSPDRTDTKKKLSIVEALFCKHSNPFLLLKNPLDCSSLVWLVFSYRTAQLYTHNNNTQFAGKANYSLIIDVTQSWTFSQGTRAPLQSADYDLTFPEYYLYSSVHNWTKTDGKSWQTNSWEKCSFWSLLAQWAFTPPLTKFFDFFF